LDGFTKTVRVAPIRIRQRDKEELVLRRMLQESARRKNEKINTLLEFLESHTCRLDNQISKDNE
jgi:hypothetical protein